MTEKQKRFCDYYIQNPNATWAAKMAGYSPKTAYKIGIENLSKPVIKEYIAKRNKQLESERIADIEEVREFWSKVLRDEGLEMKDRIKVSELIAKSHGAFLEKVDVNANVETEINVRLVDDE